MVTLLLEKRLGKKINVIQDKRRVLDNEKKSVHQENTTQWNIYEANYEVST